MPSTSRTNDFARGPFGPGYGTPPLSTICAALPGAASAVPESDPPRTTVGNEPGGLFDRHSFAVGSRRNVGARLSAGAAGEEPQRRAREQREDERGGDSSHASPVAVGDAVGQPFEVGLLAQRACLPGERLPNPVVEFAHGITFRSSARARWISDPTVPGRQPSAAAISASLLSCQKRRTIAARSAVGQRGDRVGHLVGAEVNEVDLRCRGMCRCRCRRRRRWCEWQAFTTVRRR